MSERRQNLVAVAVFAVSLAVVVVSLASSPPSDADRVHALTTRLKCPVCTSESIADSPAELSRQLVELVSEQVADGWSDDEILSFFVATYGDEVLLDPPATGRSLLLWVLPLIAALIGIGVIAGRRSRDPDTTLDAESRRRVEEALAEREGR